MKGPLIGIAVSGLLVGAGLATGLIRLGPAVPGATALPDIPRLFGNVPLTLRPSTTPPALPRRPGIVAPGGLMLPVVGITPAQLSDTWGQARDGGARAHQAIDIAAPIGTPVVAAMAGTIERMFTSGRGGLTVYLRSDDRAWEAYYAHLSGYPATLQEGQRVARGTVIGFVGETGNVTPGSPHLHFALTRMASAERWSQGQPVNPYPLLVGSGGQR